MPVTANPQASLYERTIENADLESALENRERLKRAASKASKAFREADAGARALLVDVEMSEDEPTRIGRFVLTRKTFPGRPVAFETSESERLYIRPLPDDVLGRNGDSPD